MVFLFYFSWRLLRGDQIKLSRLVTNVFIQYSPLSVMFQINYRSWFFVYSHTILSMITRLVYLHQETSVQTVYNQTILFLNTHQQQNFFENCSKSYLCFSNNTKLWDIHLNENNASCLTRKKVLPTYNISKL